MSTLRAATPSCRTGRAMFRTNRLSNSRVSSAVETSPSGHCVLREAKSASTARIRSTSARSAERHLAYLKKGYRFRPSTKRLDTSFSKPYAQKVRELDVPK
ncbi:unnamed protein product [Ixodes persulcatus]